MSNSTGSLNGNGPAFILAEHKRLKSWRKLAKRYKLKSGAHAWNVAKGKQPLPPAVAVVIARKLARPPRPHRWIVSGRTVAALAASAGRQLTADELREYTELLNQTGGTT